MVSLSIMGRSGFRLESIKFGLLFSRLLMFRHKIFREQLRWVATSEDGLDLDEYDAFSDNYAVLMGEEVVGSVRITPGDRPFMIEHEFAHLLPQNSVIHKGQQAAEVTRFAVGVGEDGVRPEPVSRLLYLTLYVWATLHQVRWMYFVVESPFFYHIRQLGFPVFPVSQLLPQENEVSSVAAFLDWEVATSSFIRWLQSAAESPAMVQYNSCESKGGLIV